jgi:hypothetical protein
MKLSSRLLAAGGLVVASASVLVGASVPAAAHGGEGKAEVTTTRSGDDVAVSVRITYEGDGHGVPGATVTVVVDDGTPSEMAAGPEEGVYEATIRAEPGATIRVTSVDPATSTEVLAPEAAEPVPTTAAEATTPSSTTETESTTTPTADEESSAPVTERTSSASDDDSGSNTVVIVAIAAVLLAAIVAALIVFRKTPADT